MFHDMKLGKLAPKPDLSLPHFDKYVGVVPPLPAATSWAGAVTTPWGMMLNDKLGDCTCAAAGHLIKLWTANSVGVAAVISDAEILKAYEDVTGIEGAAYNPTTGANDNGCVETDVLNYWKTSGVASHKIDGFVKVSPSDIEHVKLSVALFGGCYIGLAMPLSAQTQAVWDVPLLGLLGKGKPGSWGGHAVPIVDYDAQYLYVVTWGGILKMTYAFFAAYCDEAYAIVSHNWLKNGLSPVAAGAIAFSQLYADLKMVAG